MSSKNNLAGERIRNAVEHRQGERFSVGTHCQGSTLREQGSGDDADPAGQEGRQERGYPPLRHHHGPGVWEYVDQPRRSPGKKAGELIHESGWANTATAKILRKLALGSAVAGVVQRSTAGEPAGQATAGLES